MELKLTTDDLNLSCCDKDIEQLVENIILNNYEINELNSQLVELQHKSSIIEEIDSTRSKSL